MNFQYDENIYPSNRSPIAASVVTPAVSGPELRSPAAPIRIRAGVEYQFSYKDHMNQHTPTSRGFRQAANDRSGLYLPESTYLPGTGGGPHGNNHGTVCHAPVAPPINPGYPVSNPVPSINNPATNNNPAPSNNPGYPNNNTAPRYPYMSQTALRPPALFVADSPSRHLVNSLGHFSEENRPRAATISYSQPQTYLDTITDDMPSAPPILEGSINRHRHYGKGPIMSPTMPVPKSAPRQHRRPFLSDVYVNIPRPPNPPMLPAHRRSPKSLPAPPFKSIELLANALEGDDRGLPSGSSFLEGSSPSSNGDSPALRPAAIATKSELFSEVKSGRMTHFPPMLIGPRQPEPRKHATRCTVAYCVSAIEVPCDPPTFRKEDSLAVVQHLERIKTTALQFLQLEAQNLNLDLTFNSDQKSAGEIDLVDPDSMEEETTSFIDEFTKALEKILDKARGVANEQILKENEELAREKADLVASMKTLQEVQASQNISDLSTLRAEKEEIESKYKQLLSRRELLQVEWETLQEIKQSLEFRENELTLRHRSERAKCGGFYTLFTVQRKELTKLQDENTSFQLELSKLNEVKIGLQGERSALENRLKLLSEQFNEKEVERVKLINQLDELSKKQQQVESVSGSLEKNREEFELISKLLITKQNEVESVTQLLEEKQQEVQLTSQELEEKRQKIESITELLKAKQQEFESLTKSLEKKRQEFESATKSLKKKRQESDSITKLLEKKQQEFQSVTKSLEKKQEEFESVTKSLEKKEQEFESVTESLEKKQKEYESVNKSLEEKQQEFESITKLVGEEQHKLELAKKSIKELSQSLEELERQNQSQKTTCDKLQEVEEDLKARAQEAETSKEQAISDAQKLEREIKNIKDKLEQYKSRAELVSKESASIKTLTATNSELTDKIQQLEGELNKVTSELQIKQKTISQLEADVRKKDAEFADLRKSKPQTPKETFLFAKNESRQIKAQLEEAKRQLQETVTELEALKTTNASLMEEMTILQKGIYSEKSTEAELTKGGRDMKRIIEDTPQFNSCEATPTPAGKKDSFDEVRANVRRSEMEYIRRHSCCHPMCDIEQHNMALERYLMGAVEYGAADVHQVIKQVVNALTPLGYGYDRPLLYSKSSVASSKLPFSRPSTTAPILSRHQEPQLPRFQQETMSSSKRRSSSRCNISK